MNSPTLQLSTIDNYAENKIAQRISMLSGVALVNVFGSAKYAVRAQVDPNILASRGIALSDVEAADIKYDPAFRTATLSSAYLDIWQDNRAFPKAGLDNGFQSWQAMSE